MNTTIKKALEQINANSGNITQNDKKIENIIIDFKTLETKFTESQKSIDDIKDKIIKSLENRVKNVEEYEKKFSEKLKELKEDYVDAEMTIIDNKIISLKERISENVTQIKNNRTVISDNLGIADKLKTVESMQKAIKGLDDEIKLLNEFVIKQIDSKIKELDISTNLQNIKNDLIEQQQEYALGIKSNKTEINGLKAKLQQAINKNKAVKKILDKGIITNDNINAILENYAKQTDLDKYATTEYVDKKINEYKKDINNINNAVNEAKIQLNNFIKNFNEKQKGYEDKMGNLEAGVKELLKVFGVAVNYYDKEISNIIDNIKRITEKYDKDIKNIANRVNDIDSDISELNKFLERLIDKLDDFYSQVNKKLEKLEEIDNNLAGIFNAHNDLATDFNNEKIEINKIISKLKDEIRSNLLEIIKNKGDVNYIISDYAKKTDLKELDKKIAKNNSEIDSLKKNITDIINTEIKNLQKSLASNAKSNIVTNKKVEEQIKQLKELKKDITSYEVAQTNMNENYKEIIKITTKLQGLNTTLDNKIMEFMNKYAKQIDLQKLKSSINENINKANIKIDSNATNIQNNTANINTNTTDIQDNNSKIINNIGNIVSLNEDIKKANTSIQTNKNDIQTNTADIQTNKNNIQNNATDIQTNKNNIQINKNNIQTNKNNFNNYPSKADLNKNIKQIQTNIYNKIIKDKLSGLDIAKVNNSLKEIDNLIKQAQNLNLDEINNKINSLLAGFDKNDALKKLVATLGELIVYRNMQLF